MVKFKQLNSIGFILWFIGVGLYATPLYAVNINKYDWNKTVKWRTNPYGEPIDACYNYQKGSVDYRQCSKKAKQIFAHRCRYGQKGYCSKQLKRSAARSTVQRTSRVKKTGNASAVLK